MDGGQWDVGNCSQRHTLPNPPSLVAHVAKNWFSLK